MQDQQTETIQTKEKPGYKKTKLGWIPEDWEIERIGDHYDFKNGLNKGKDFFGKGTPIINYRDVYNQKHIWKDKVAGQVTVNDSEKKRYSTKRGDVFFTRTSETINEIGFNSVLVEDIKDGVFSGFVLRARPRKNNAIFPEYAGYCFKTYAARKEIIRKSTYTTRALTNGSYLSEVLFPLPTYEEQKNIAKCLDLWDQALRITNSLLIHKSFLKKGLMQQLLTGKKRLPGFRGEWKEYKLENFFKERKEKGFDNLPLLSIGEAGVYPQSDSNKKDTSNKDKSKYKRIYPGDIGYNTMRLWQGRNALSQLEGIISPAYTVVKPKENAHAEFFKYLFKLPEVVHKFFRNSQGLVSDTLNCKFKDFKIVKVMLPPTLEEQIAIANILHSADEEIKLLKRKKEMFQTQKKGLMQQLLTGKKRIKN